MEAHDGIPHEQPLVEQGLILKPSTCVCNETFKQCRLVGSTFLDYDHTSWFFTLTVIGYLFSFSIQTVLIQEEP